MKKYIIGVLIALLIIAGITTTVLVINKNSEKENVGMTTIQLNEVTRSVFYSPQYVAIVNRIF